MRKIITLIIFLSYFFGLSQTKEIDSLSLQLAYQAQDTLKVKTSLKIIKSLYNIKDYERASKYIIESEKLSTSLKFSKGIAEITYYKALIYSEKGDYLNAVSGYNKSKELYKQLNDSLGIAKVNNSIGLIEIKRGNYAKGLQYSLAAIKVLEKKHLLKDLSLAYTNLANAYYKINAVEKSIDFNLKASEIQEQLKDTKGLILSSIQLAELYSQKNENRKAIEYYEKVLNGSNSRIDTLRGSIYPRLGSEYLKFNDFNKASQYLLEGLEINRKANNKAGILLSLNSLGELNLETNRLKIAEQQLFEAGTLAKSINNKPELLRYYKLMIALDSTNRQFDRAFIWQREYFNLKNSIHNNSALKFNNADSVNLEFNPNFEKDIITPNALEPSNANYSGSKEEFDKFKLIFYGLLAALAIVSTFLILIYLKRNTNIKYTQELEEKNLKIELQNEAFSEQTKHLENVNNVKDKLFSIVSHDLKDSLSSINGFIDLLKDGSLSREEFDNLIPELSENANNASLLLYNLLNWSKSQMQSLEPKPTLFDVQEVFEEKVRLIEQRMENKGIELVDHSLRDFAYADRSMFEIVVQNLLANALKFCKKGDSITISNHISNGSCIISIADTGIGISKQNIEKLFKNSSFTTVGTNNEKGTGLGLSICKELVELNNGKIWVESTINVGSTFYVQLPKSRPS